MAILEDDTIGILPAGALGVAFFYHLTRRLRQVDGSVVFVERTGSASGRAMREQGRLRIDTGEKVEELEAPHLFRPDLQTCFSEARLPGILLVCVNPDQLLDVIDSLVGLLERAASQDRLEELPLPTVLLCANGIYFQRVRQVYLEKLEESTLLGRLPDLWPEPMTRIVARLLRGVSIQTSLREGHGAGALYRPGPRGRTRVAGGEAGVRDRSCRQLAARGGWFEPAAHQSPTRLEFDKALVNLAANLLGQLYAFDEEGRFEPLRVEQIATPDHAGELEELARRVFEVGRAVNAYGRTDRWEEVHEAMTESLQSHAHHVPSSLQWVDLQIRRGTLQPRLTPTEGWLLDPLIRYAQSAGLEETAAWFGGLRQRLLARLKAAARRLSGGATPR